MGTESERLLGALIGTPLGIAPPLSVPAASAGITLNYLLMSYQPNDQYKESTWDEFQEALENDDTETCERIIRATRSAGFSSLADQLDALLTDDVTFEPYEHPQPPVLEKAWVDGDIRSESEDERLEQMHLEQLRKAQ